MPSTNSETLHNIDVQSKMKSNEGMFEEKAKAIVSLNQVNIAQADVIDLTIDNRFLDDDLLTLDVACKSTSGQMWIPDLKLHQTDKSILLDPHAWLNDANIINAAMNLLKTDDMHGLQDVITAQAEGFHSHSKMEKNGQIMNIRNCHWITLSNVFCESTPLCKLIWAVEKNA